MALFLKPLSIQCTKLNKISWLKRLILSGMRSGIHTWWRRASWWPWKIRRTSPASSLVPSTCASSTIERATTLRKCSCPATSEEPNVAPKTSQWWAWTQSLFQVFWRTKSDRWRLEWWGNCIYVFSRYFAFCPPCYLYTKGKVFQSEVDLSSLGHALSSYSHSEARFAAW